MLLQMAKCHSFLWQIVFCYVYIYHSFFIHLSVDGHLGHFHILATVNNAAMNTGGHVSFWTSVWTHFDKLAANSGYSFESNGSVWLQESLTAQILKLDSALESWWFSVLAMGPWVRVLIVLGLSSLIYNIVIIIVRILLSCYLNSMN